jgi:uncharacterized protein
MDSNEFHAGIAAGDLEAVREAVVRSPGLLGQPAPGGATPIRWALYHRHGTLAAWLASQLAPDLHDAAALGDAAALDALLDGGADVQAWCPEGFQAIHLAAFFARAEALHRLLAAGADANAKARHPAGMRPLHSVAASRDASIVARLLAAGADPDPQQAGGYTALMAAAMHDLGAMVDALLAAGADTAVRADDGRSAADMARDAGHLALASRLDGNP